LLKRSIASLRAILRRRSAFGTLVVAMKIIPFVVRASGWVAAPPGPLFV
jgi:hypothetical protein